MKNFSQAVNKMGTAFCYMAGVLAAIELFISLHGGSIRQLLISIGAS